MQTEPARPRLTAAVGSAAAQEGQRGSTIYDVAEAAGVNASTVSRALNRPDRVSPATRKKVLDAARLLSYRANPAAAELRSSRYRTIGLVLPGFNTSISSALTIAVEAAATAYGCALIVSGSQSTTDMEGNNAKKILDASDGVIFLEPKLADDVLREIGAEKPIVLVDRAVEGMPSVMTPTAAGLAQAARYLASMRHQQLVYLVGKDSPGGTRQAIDSLRDQCVWLGVTLQVFMSDRRGVQSGQIAAREVRASGCTAVLCDDDLTAIGLMQELQAGGISVPGEVSIIGWGNAPSAALTTPTLSTVQTSGSTQGRIAVDSLMHLWRGITAPPIPQLTPELILRESSGTAPATRTVAE